ncbi:DDE-type integrase/transposase/recombinase [Nocardia sp. NPDC050713]|uniref:DDE-type integrase/transposase/recombinase n=1 Tax=Nocardia sp. NPDC050713 TaxID=3154511 RepID=UPI0033EBE4FE
MRVADATHIPCGQAAFWLAAVRDAFSDRIVGWNLPTAAMPSWFSARWNTVWSREIRDGQSIHHSDRDSTHTAIRFANRLADNGIVQSKGSVGDSTTTRMMASFWSRMQVERLNHRRWNTWIELADAIFDYLEIFHNRQSRHSSLGMLTPIVCWRGWSRVVEDEVPGRAAYADPARASQQMSRRSRKLRPALPWRARNRLAAAQASARWSISMWVQAVPVCRIRTPRCVWRQP